MVPREDRRRAAVWPPGFAERAYRFFVGPRVEFENTAHIDLHGQIASRPDIGPSFGEQQIDFGRPAPDGP